MYFHIPRYAVNGDGQAHAATTSVTFETTYSSEPIAKGICQAAMPHHPALNTLASESFAGHTGK